MGEVGKNWREEGDISGEEMSRVEFVDEVGSTLEGSK